tara:strand:- start:99 stop:392 length:294 start_codon:yes stop_codon:yes gene_type:complete
MSLLKRLFGSKSSRKAADDPVETYKGFRIVVAPMSEGSKFRLAARIEHDVEGETRVHHVIRADTFDGLEQAQEVSLAKAKQVIDEQGKMLFRGLPPA